MKRMHSLLVAVLLALTTTAFVPSAVAATLTFCPKLKYSFDDQGKGEDGLLHSGPSGLGYQPAAYARAWLQKDGNVVFDGHLNSSGCFAPVTRQSGSYNIVLQSLVKTPGSSYPRDVTFDVRNSSLNPAYFIQSLTHTSGSTNITLSINLGSGDPVSNMMAVATQFAVESLIGLSNDDTIYLFDNTYESSPGFSNSQYCVTPNGTTCFWNRTVAIGQTGGISHTKSKYTIAHEMGHAIQDKLFGLFETDYGYTYNGTNSQTQLCGCSHVPLAERPHCLQSMENIGAAQNEGFAHFIAADAMNNDSEGDGVFVYYKPIRWTYNGTPTSLWEPVNTHTAWKWQANTCGSNSDDHGVEMDWMNFFYALHASYSPTPGSSKWNFAPIRDVYRRACAGGLCSGLQRTWGDLTTATNAEFGLLDPKTSHWNDQGALYRVDN